MHHLLRINMSIINQTISAWENSLLKETCDNQICTEIKLKLVHLLQQHTYSFIQGKEWVVTVSHNTQLLAEEHEAVWKKPPKIQHFCNILKCICRSLVQPPYLKWSHHLMLDQGQLSFVELESWTFPGMEFQHLSYKPFPVLCYFSLWASFSWSFSRASHTAIQSCSPLMYYLGLDPTIL